MKARFSPRWSHLGTAALAMAVLAAGCSGAEGTEEQGSFGPLPGNVAQEVVERGPNPEAQTITLSNAGNCPLAVTIATQTSDGAAWLSVSSTSGTVAPGTSQALSVALDVVGPPALLPGTYTGTITITGTCETTGRPAAGSPAVVAVNLTVTPLWASIEVDETEVTQDVAQPNADWLTMTSVGAPAVRSGHLAVWTGYEMIVWGGYSLAQGLLNTGAAYDPLLDSWNKTATTGATARSLHTAVWTGSKMIVWGGSDELTSLFSQTGGVYAPASRSWSATTTTNAPEGRSGHTAVWTGSKMIVWGGDTFFDTNTNTGGVYNPGTDTWEVVSPAGAPGPRMGHTAVWTGSKMIVWGGTSNHPISTTSTGGVYDPATNSWSPTSLAGAPSARANHTAVWTGRKMIVWGGTSEVSVAGKEVATGAAYDPETDTWSLIAASGAPEARSEHIAVWTGSLMLVWRGKSTSWHPIAAGGMYETATDKWFLFGDSPKTLATGRASVWAGESLLSWGNVYQEPNETWGGIFY